MDNTYFFKKDNYKFTFTWVHKIINLNSKQSTCTNLKFEINGNQNW